ncbi:hypothetical protein SORBI_3008G184800 [Sorghum bicolor]|uniref:Peptidase A1 domain-containing protein n=1 Tax=Sorghum bicolor TaxID=4558 RepID=A0A1Z5R803_SORBI|nr:hypothetical protein SORBI_3008G184800 [Sorghum bicolor]
MNLCSVAFASLFSFCLLLLPAKHGASSHGSYKLGPRQIFFKTSDRSSSGDSHQASRLPPATTCSSMATGLDNNKLPIVHRQSPWSPLHGLPSLTTADVLHRDTSLVRRRRRFSSQSSVVAAPTPALSPAAATIIPANGSSDPSTLPGALDYIVLVSYGSPEQQFPVFLGTNVGTSLLRCKPCASGSDDCNPAFDTLQSSTFAHVPCSSPDCPVNCSSSVCPFYDLYGTVGGTFATDVLTLAPSSMAVHDFRFVCMDVESPSPDLPEAGSIDLSRHRNSLPSQLSSSSGIAPTAASFSYCLPQSRNSQGFLSLGGDATVVGDDDNLTVHAPMVWNNDPDLASMYFIDLVGMSLGGEDLPIPSGTFGNASTNLDVGATFTMLAPEAYTTLRDAFRKEMSQYNNRSSPAGFDGFDTCFNFTGLNELVVPLVQLKFSNGESLMIDGDQMLYYHDPAAGPFTMACLAFSSLDVGDSFSAVIGTYTLASTEVVYDVAGGKVGFIPWRC